MGGSSGDGALRRNRGALAAWSLAVAIAGGLAWAPAAQAQQPAPAVGAGSAAPTQKPRNDYGNPANWLCRPGRSDDACAIDLTTTVVAASGKLDQETFKALAEPAIDCFYVYPTVSLDPTPNSDMNAGAEERSVIRAQFARFASRCRVFAPLYRQVTLGALRAATAGQPAAVDRALPLQDVTDAWQHYLANDNRGRGVVLVGHSQGSGVLTQLIRSEIDGKPVQKQLVSALLIGTNLPVPKGKDVGGAFQQIPLCRAADQIGCAIAYASFREDAPPPDNTRFGRVRDAGQQAACVNPAALAGGRGELRAYLPTIGRFEGTEWVKGAAIKTPFVSLPGLLSAECVQTEKDSYLAIKTQADTADPRLDRVPGDVEANGQISRDWGLHLIDVQAALGNLLDVVATQSAAYQSENKK
jgi:hypothetical protein